MDQRATEHYGIPSLILMENAGRAVFDVAEQVLGKTETRAIVVVCGPGNNGGDGFAAARHLHIAGESVSVFYFGDRSAAKGDALTNIQIAEKMGLDIDYSGDVDNLQSAIDEAGLVIDALLGTGAKGELRPETAEVVGCMNLRGGSALVAVDIPSGVDADTGVELGPKEDPEQAAVSADVTVTFALPKIGLVTYPGAELAGRLVIADIGIPQEALEDNDSTTFLIGSDDMRIDPRPRDANKGMFGHLAIVAGSVGMTGAATLAADGALRIGTGLVTLAVPESLNDIMEVKVTEGMTVPVPEGNARAFGMASLERVLEIVEKRDAAVIGPGFGRNEDTIAFTQELVKRLARPAIIDADALYALSKNLDVLKQCAVPVVITPHPGEMATLLGTTPAQVQSNRLEVARSFANDYGVTVVLKGAATIVADPEGVVFINTTGTPGMATGGTGDVLSGMIGGLLAAYPEDQQCLLAATAVYLHGRAGELAAERLGEESMLASDVVDDIADAIQEVTNRTCEKE